MAAPVARSKEVSIVGVRPGEMRQPDLHLEPKWLRLGLAGMRYGKSFRFIAVHLRFAIIGFVGVASRFASLARHFRKRVLLQDLRQLAISS